MKYVFISGINRSGTTLLLSLMSGHSRLAASAFEDGFVEALARAPQDFIRALQRRRLDELFAAITYHTKYAQLKLSALAGKRNLAHTDAFSSGLAVDFDFETFECQFIDALSRDGMTLDAVQPVDVLRAFYTTLAAIQGEGDKDYFVTKPGSGSDVFCRASRFYGPLEPRVIVIVRDPRAVVASSLHSKSLAGVNGSAEARIVEAWLHHQHHISVLSKKHPVNVVSYEKLCLDPADVMRDVSDFLEVPMEDAFMNPTFMGNAFSGNSSFESHDGTISPRSVDRWKTILSTEQCGRIEAYAGTELNRSGYEPVQPRKPSRILYRARMTLIAGVSSLGSRLPTDRRSFAILCFCLGVVSTVVLCLLAKLIMQ